MLAEPTKRQICWRQICRLNIAHKCLLVLQVLIEIISRTSLFSQNKLLTHGRKERVESKQKHRQCWLLSVVYLSAYHFRNLSKLSNVNCIPMSKFPPWQSTCELPKDVSSTVAGAGIVAIGSAGAWSELIQKATVNVENLEFLCTCGKQPYSFEILGKSVQKHYPSHFEFQQRKNSTLLCAQNAAEPGTGQLSPHWRHGVLLLGPKFASLPTIAA